jgi:hypothetical protein
MQIVAGHAFLVPTFRPAVASRPAARWIVHI